MNQTLTSVSYTSILNGDSWTQQRVVDACRSDGAFELNVQDVEGLAESTQQMYQLSAMLHELPEEYKMQWEMDKFSDLQIAG